MPTLPATMGLLELIQGSIVTQSIYVAAKLGIADVLGDEPLTAEEIAQRVEAHPEATYRLLRLLSSYSIFAEQDDGRFTLTPMAEALRSDAPASMRGLALLMGHPTQWEDWSQLLDSVRTGEPGLPKLRGMGAFEYLDANPEYAMVFFQGMGSLSSLETDPLLAAYDFSRFGTIVDVGGGRGALLAAILEHASNSRGVLFDAPSATAGAEALFADVGVAGRCTIENGSYFDPVPAGGDAYILKHIVHDWAESAALAILKNVRDAISADGTLLLMEFVLAEGNVKHLGKLVDLWLMLLVGGKERTERQYAELLASAGFRLSRVVRTASALSIVEARPD
jgi:O-methyltransferase domain/Dimerisation domain